MLVVTARPCQQSDNFRAITAQNQDQGTRLESRLRVRFKFVQQRDDFREVAGPLVFFIVGKMPWLAIAKVVYLIPDGLQPFHDAGFTEGGGRLLASREKCSSTGGRANQGN